MGGGEVLAEIEVLVAHHGTIAQLIHHGVELIEVLHPAALSQHAGAVSGGLLKGVERLGKTQRGHLHGGDGAVGQDLNALGAGLAGEAGAVGHPVVKDVPLVAHLHDGAVIIAGGVIIAVVHNVAAIGEGAGRLIGCGIGQAAALAGRVDQVIGVADLAGRAGLEEALLLRHTFPIVDHMMLQAAGQYSVHGGGIQLVHVGGLKAVVDVHAAVVVHQHAGVVVHAVVARILRGVLIGADDLEGALRLVRHTHAALVKEDVGEQIVLAVLLHAIRGVHHMLVSGHHVRPGHVGRMILVRLGMEDVAVAGPVIEVVDGRRPDLQADIAEITGHGAIMGTVEIHAVAEHAGFAVRNMFPQGQDGVGHDAITFLSSNFRLLVLPLYQQSPHLTSPNRIRCIRRSCSNTNFYLYYILLL